MRQEAHRVYWQQWSASASASTSTASSSQQHTEHPVITAHSAAVRISDEATALDVTRLLRKATTSTSSLPIIDDQVAAPHEDDSLVLVGTLYNHTIQFPSLFQYPEEAANTTKVAEPMHVLHTLQPHENPLTVRDRMKQDLQQRQQSSSSSGDIAPTLQWFFVPSSSSQILNYIQLDGYCTSFEQEESDFGDGDGDDGSYDENKGSETECVATKSSSNAHWWRTEEPFVANAPLTLSQQQQHAQEQAQAPSKHRQQRKGQEQVLRRYSTLMDHYHDGHVVSGFLSLRSKKDKHAWKRVYCVLTDDHFWFASRLLNCETAKSTNANAGSTANSTATTANDNDTTTARHDRIELHRALLVQEDYAHQHPFEQARDANLPSSLPSTAMPTTTPFAFQLVSQSGKSYVFRAPNRIMQQRWMSCLAQRIVICHDNQVLQHAELIVEDEALARNRRLSSVAFEPLLPAVNNHGDRRRNDDDGKSSNEFPTTTIYTAPSKEELQWLVLQWGMAVAEYKEACRHLGSRLPAKRPVVVVRSNDESDSNPNASNPTPRRLFVSSSSNDNDGDGSDSSEGQVVMANDVNHGATRELISFAWDLAARLLARARQLVVVQAGAFANGKRSYSLETLCQHVDYVLTGQFRPWMVGASGGDGVFATGNATVAPTVGAATFSTARSLDRPPPSDLLDALLAELQAACCRTTGRIGNDYSAKSTSSGQHAPIDTPLLGK